MVVSASKYLLATAITLEKPRKYAFHVGVLFYAGGKGGEVGGRLVGPGAPGGTGGGPGGMTRGVSAGRGRGVGRGGAFFDRHGDDEIGGRGAGGGASGVRGGVEDGTGRPPFGGGRGTIYAFRRSILEAT